MTRLTSEFSPLWLDLDPETGLPKAIGTTADSRAVSVTADLALLLGGTDHRGALGDFEYDGAATASIPNATGAITNRLECGARVFSVPVRLGGWAGKVHYAFKATAPSLTMSFLWEPEHGAEAIREFTVDMAFAVDRPESTMLNIGGAQLRPDLPFRDLPEQMPINSWSSHAASASIFALTEDDARTLVFWPRVKQEHGATLMRTTPDSIGFSYATGLACSADAGVSIGVDGIGLDLIASPWSEILPNVSDWFADIGLTTPRDRPDWTARATIFELQIGTSIFGGGSFNYAPYPDMQALYDDLPRIRDLGFDTLQIMPKQPYPSYNIVDFDDIDLTYGDEDMLKRVVAWCHANDMKVILDVLMHGVIDQESFSKVVEAVKSGPWKDRLSAGVEEVADMRLTAQEQNDLSWSRHIIDFERAWFDNSPSRHEMADRHPDWFCRGSSGEIMGIYTKAYDQAHPEWQRYFSDAMVMLVERLGIDGFRFDAPGYNRFPNWSERSRSHASLQQLGATVLFRDLRKRLRALDPQLMLYTEPNGAVWRESMDITYNYDETWLPDSMFGRGGDHPQSAVRNARELAAWMSQRDLTLPAGSVTAHHIDSHDTFWWPLPGVKWRREQFGIDAAAALMSTFALSGGPYMMFVGGESGMEDAVARVNRIRALCPEVGLGQHAFLNDESVPTDLFVVRHTHGDLQSILVVNLGRTAVPWSIASTGAAGDWFDTLGGSRSIAGSASLTFAPLSAAFFVPDGRRASLGLSEES